MVVYEEPLGMQPKVAATRAPQDPKSGTWHSADHDMRPCRAKICPKSQTLNHG